MGIEFQSAVSRIHRSRLPLYFAVNASFGILLLIARVNGAAANVSTLYLMVLFLLCSLWIIPMRQLNDRYALLAIHSLVYFMFYGLTDTFNLLFGTPGLTRKSGVNQSELVILFGTFLSVAAYLAVCAKPARVSTARRDWSELRLVSVGLSLWLLCTALTWHLRVFLITDASTNATLRAVSSMSGGVTAIYMVAGTLQPLGIVIMAYARQQHPKAYLSWLLIGMVLMQLVFGFVTDVKADALLGFAIVLFVATLVSSRIPKMWVFVTVTFIALAFPVMQANRTVRSEGGFARADVLQNLKEIVSRSVSESETTKTSDTEAESFFERLSLKGSTQLIVSNVGVTTPFQQGYTLSPLWTSLIPRLIWPSKPDVQAGQVMNRAFGVSEVADTYISPSHLGELYWNFGWLGAFVGMLLIGALLGFIGRVSDLSTASSLMKVLLIVATIRLLVLGAEGTIAVQYSQWIRSVIAVLVLDAIFARAIQPPGAKKRAPSQGIYVDRSANPLP